MSGYCFPVATLYPGAVASGASFMGSSDLRTVPGDGEDRLSSTMELGGGFRLEFRSWANAQNTAQLPVSIVSGIVVDGRVEIRLIGPDSVTLISETSSSSPNSGALPLVASKVEVALRAAGADVAPPNLEELETASSKAYRASVVHTVSAFASFFVDRVGHLEASEIWRTAVIRHIMTS